MDRLHLDRLQRLLCSFRAMVLALVLTGCVSTGLPTASASPWQPVDIHSKSNPLDLAFTDG